MDEQRAFHWFGFLVIGYWSLAGVFLILVDAGATRQILEVIAAGDGFWTGAAAVAVVSVVAYTIGSLVWGIGYFAGGFFMSPFLCDRASGVSALLSRRRYREVRVQIASRAFSQLGLEVPTDYPHLRLQMVRAQEWLTEYVGPRLSAQWEYIGLLQALMLVWLSATVVLLAIAALSLAGISSFRGIVPSATGYALPLSVLMLLAVGTGLTYRIRNDALARDLAAAVALLPNSAGHARSEVSGGGSRLA